LLASVEGAIEVAAAEVHPDGLLEAGGLDGAGVVGRELDAGRGQVLLAVLPVLERERCHGRFPSLSEPVVESFQQYFSQTGISL